LTITCSRWQYNRLRCNARHYSMNNMTAFMLDQIFRGWMGEKDRIRAFSTSCSKRPCRRAKTPEEKTAKRKIRHNFKITAEAHDTIVASARSMGVPISHFLLYCCTEGYRPKFLSSDSISRRGMKAPVLQVQRKIRKDLRERLSRT